jgi:hypothetical protein
MSTLCAIKARMQNWQESTGELMRKKLDNEDEEEYS